jgi:radical SAM protein with 4Fe4S-binding SPASM domain
MWNEYPQKFKVAFFPIHLDIELNTTCNYECKKCFQSFDPPDPEFMPLETYRKIIDEGAKKGLCSVKLNYRGEPLCYPHIVEAVKYAKEKGIIDVMFNTNGSLLTLEKNYKLMEGGLDKLIVSIDDHRENVYTQFQGGKLCVVLNNIKNLQVMKSFHNYSTPLVRIQKVNRPELQDKNEEYIEFMRPYADHIAIHEYLDYKCVDNPKPFPSWCCASLWQRMLILADGTITSCCGLNAHITELGNIQTHTVEELWHGDTMKLYRNLHMNGKSHKIKACRNCALRLHYLK